jgi:hypothetical protein
VWDRVFDPVVAPIAKGLSPGESRASACKTPALGRERVRDPALREQSDGSDCRILSAIPLARDLLQHRGVRGLRRVSAVKWKCCAPGAVRVGSDPRVLVGESPGLNRGAARSLQACPNHATIDRSLAKKVFVPGQATGVQGQGYVEFRDVNLDSQRAQARDIGAMAAVSKSGCEMCNCKPTPSMGTPRCLKSLTIS